MKNLSLAVVAALVVTACSGPTGPTGSPGATGPTGVTGPTGPTGIPGTSFVLVGAWAPETSYRLNDVVTYLGSSFSCNAVCAIPGWYDPPEIGSLGWQLLAQVGPQGIPGVTGPTGAQGAQGPQGTQGAQGVPGVTGPTGPQGTQGLQGLTGLPGPQGTQGVKGDTGTQGTQGVQGLTGPTGPTGPQGSGMTWLGDYAAETAYLTGDAVSYNGSSYLGTNPVFNMAPDQTGSGWDMFASAGVDGMAGSPGAPGEPGPQGTPGRDGFSPIVATDYYGCPNGGVSITDRDFVSYLVCNGAPGAEGPMGMQGAPGMQGVPGLDGPQGPQGIQGIAGISVRAYTLAIGNPTCPYGGSLFESSTGNTYACNGAPGGGGEATFTKQPALGLCYPKQAFMVSPAGSQMLMTSAEGNLVWQLDGSVAAAPGASVAFQAQDSFGASLGTCQIFIGGAGAQGGMIYRAIFYSGITMNGAFAWFVPTAG